MLSEIYAKYVNKLGHILANIILNRMCLLRMVSQNGPVAVSAVAHKSNACSAFASTFTAHDLK